MKKDVEAPPTGFVAERLGEVGFPDAGGAVNQDVLVPFDEPAGRAVDNLGDGYRVTRREASQGGPLSGENAWSPMVKTAGILSAEN